MKVYGSVYLPKYRYTQYIAIDRKIYVNTAAKQDAPILAKIVPYMPNAASSKENRYERY